MTPSAQLAENREPVDALFSDSQLNNLRCNRGHSGSRKLVGVRGNRFAECERCGTVFSPDDVTSGRFALALVSAEMAAGEQK